MIIELMGLMLEANKIRIMNNKGVNKLIISIFISSSLIIKSSNFLVNILTENNAASACNNQNMPQPVGNRYREMLARHLPSHRQQ